jgi:hypothetical protein
MSLPTLTASCRRPASASRAARPAPAARPASGRPYPALPAVAVLYRLSSAEVNLTE